MERHMRRLRSEPGRNLGNLAVDVTLTFDLAIKNASPSASAEFHQENAQMLSLRDLLENPEVFYTWLIDTSSSVQLPATIPFGLASLRNRKEGSSKDLWLTVHFPAPMGQGCLDVHQLISKGAYAVSVRFELPNTRKACREQRRHRATMSQSSSSAGTPASSSHDGELVGGLQRITFQPGKLGITFVSTGEVTTVEAGGQGERLGVKLGWQVINVDGKPWTWDAVRSLISGQQCYIVAFRTV